MIEILTKAASSLVWVVIVGVLLGAGLPALYAAGMRCLMLGRAVGADGEPVGKASVQGVTLAGVCFAIVILAIVYGIAIIVFGSKVLPF